ncbi:MAG TPA: hypothetical protein VFQ53_31515 [Kofleriaceae bacterium]|nr:hypothetical protein [Kofleriaceae bacterium]
MRLAILAVPALLLIATEARADGLFAEVHAGIAIPVADDEYTDNADESFKLGARLGSGSATRAIDLAFDFTPVNDELSSAFATVDVSRYRIQLGGRVASKVAPNARLFGRVSAGVDLLRYHAYGSVLGVDFDQSETDAGLALEVEGGVIFDLGKVSLVAWLGVPMAFHFDDDDPNDATDADLEYTGIDLDLTAAVSIPF